MRKVLVLFAHPAHRHSVVNNAMGKVAQGLDNVTFADLYGEYPRMKIDIDREQVRLAEHDALVFQFPLMWYSTPSILKEWQDLVLEYGYAYGEGGDRLKDMPFLPVVSAGGPQTAYHPDGFNNFDLRTFLAPLEQTANLCKMRFMPPFVLFGALKAPGDTRLETHLGAYRDLLIALRDETFDFDKTSEMDELAHDRLPIRKGARR